MFKRTFERTFKQRTKVGPSYSDWFEVIREILQGSTLGPLLFNIFINDVFVIQKSYICNFAENSDDDSKKPLEGSSGSYTEEADVFEEVVQSTDCRKVLFNCLNNLEQKMNDLYMLANSNKEMKIKADKKLIDLTSSGKFLISKFDDLEKERKEKHELINTLQIEISSLKFAVKSFEKKADDHKQYLNRNYLLNHGLNETKTTERDKMVLDIEMSQVNIGRSHM